MQGTRLCVARVLQGMLALCGSTSEGRSARQSHASDGNAVVITRRNHGLNGESILILTEPASNYCT